MVEGYYSEGKFREFNRMIRESKKKDYEMVLVAWPKVLGDNYAEIHENLNRIAEAGLKLAFGTRTPEGY